MDASVAQLRFVFNNTHLANKENRIERGFYTSVAETPALLFSGLADCVGSGGQLVPVTGGVYEEVDAFHEDASQRILDRRPLTR